MPQADRKKIYEHLFEDGVCIAKKDYNLKSHPEIKGIKNLYVIKALKVWLKSNLSQFIFSIFRVWHRAASSKNRFFYCLSHSCLCLLFKFAWRHYYFYLNPEGIAYLREYLGLPEDVLPNTHKQRTEQARMAFPDKGGRGRKHMFFESNMR